VAVCLSKGKGTAKQPVAEGELVTGHGFAGDAHAGLWHRQVSLLSTSSIAKMQDLGIDVREGSFAENLTIDGLDVYLLPVGTRLRAGNDALLEVTQIGKECHAGCAIFQAVGKCVMPKEGIFARVLQGGLVRPGDDLVILETGGRPASEG
jgi:MOSC domain-containing protein YiiM